MTETQALFVFTNPTIEVAFPEEKTVFYIRERETILYLQLPSMSKETETLRTLYAEDEISVEQAAQLIEMIRKEQQRENTDDCH